MIVRILGEGQLELPDRVVAELNQLDAALESAVADNDEPAFEKVLAYLLGRVRAFGTPVPVNVVVPSEAILPAPETTIAEVRQMLGADGLIPG
ncbi:MAG: hypothetical protein ABI903_18095 [Actinomycetota bacterium]